MVAHAQMACNFAWTGASTIGMHTRKNGRPIMKQSSTASEENRNAPARSIEYQ